MYFMLATSLSVMSATLVLKLHYSGFNNEPPPWLRFLVFDMMAVCLCYRSAQKWSRNHRNCVKHNINMKILKNSDIKRNGAPCSLEKHPCKRSVRFQSSPLSTTIVNRASTSASTQQTTNLLVTSIGRNYGTVTLCNIPTKKHISMEWQKISEVLDRFFFWIFLIFILIPLVSLAGFVRVFPPVY